MNNLSPPLVYLGLIEQNDCAGIRRVGCNWSRTYGRGFTWRSDGRGFV